MAAAAGAAITAAATTTAAATMAAAAEFVQTGLGRGGHLRALFLRPEPEARTAAPQKAGKIQTEKENRAGKKNFWRKGRGMG